MTLEIVFHGLKFIVPKTKDLTQASLIIESGPNRCHRIDFFSQEPNKGGYYQVKELVHRGNKDIGLESHTKTDLIPVNAGESTSTKTYDEDIIDIIGS